MSKVLRLLAYVAVGFAVTVAATLAVSYVLADDAPPAPTAATGGSPTPTAVTEKPLVERNTQYVLESLKHEVADALVPIVLDELDRADGLQLSNVLLDNIRFQPSPTTMRDSPTQTSQKWSARANISSFAGTLCDVEVVGFIVRNFVTGSVDVTISKVRVCGGDVKEMR